MGELYKEQWSSESAGCRVCQFTQGVLAPDLASNFEKGS